MLSIEETLQMPVFAGAKLVAGAGGRDNLIRWVHIVDIPDPNLEWAKGGELLLTAGFGLKDSPERQREFIPQLVKKELAGLVISVGYYVRSTPEIMREAADELGFPIIELPHTVPFIDVTEAIFTQIVNRQYALAKRTEEIHNTLTNLVLEGAALQQVAETLAQLLHRSITIESVSFEVLATAQVGNVDEARMRSVRQGRTTPDLATHLLERGIYDRLLAGRGPVRVRTMPELGMNMERIVAPIIVAKQIIGYVWIIAGDSRLTDLDELAIKHAATVAALIMFKERAVREKEATLRGDLLAQLLNASDPPDSELVERAHRFDFKLNARYQALVIAGHASAGEGDPDLHERVEEWLQDQHPALVVVRDWRVVVILQGHRTPNGERIARNLVAALSHPGERLLIGVGRAVNDVTDIGGSYEQAMEALEVMESLGRTEGVMRFVDLGVLHWLRNLPPSLLQDNAYIDIVRHLADYDARHQTRLLETLETYLDHGTASAETASYLYVHRNTLAYRLERIEKITKLDLKNADCRLNLHIAIKSYHLNNH